MSITVEINSQQLNSAESLQVHYLPAKIDGDGPTDVDKNFNVYTRATEGGYLVNALRGYPLKGEELQVPTGYKALALQETQRPLDDKADRRLRIKASFEKFSYWNYDKIPSKADAYKQALQIIDIAEELAAPVSQAEIDAELEKQKQRSITKENN